DKGAKKMDNNSIKKLCFMLLTFCKLTSLSNSKSPENKILQLVAHVCFLFYRILDLTKRTHLYYLDTKFRHILMGYGCIVLIEDYGNIHQLHRLANNLELNILHL